jgi:hypothetical protein
MKILFWVSEHRPLFIGLICLLAIICESIYQRHLKQGKFRTEDLGYFWRIWQKGERDGKIMIYSVFSAMLIGVILVASLLSRIK